MKFIMTLLICLTSTLVEAQVFKISVTDYAGIDSTPALKNLIDTQLLKLQDKVNDRLPSGGKGKIMQGMANANVLAGKNISSDYTSGMEVWLAGASLSGAVDLNDNRASDISGVGVAPGLTVGANMRKLGVGDFLGLDAQKLNLYVNFLKLSHEQSLYEREGIDADGKIDSSTFGFRLRYDLIHGRGKKLLGWGGVKLHSGYQFTRTEYTINSDVNKIVSAANSDGTINGTVTGNPKLRIDAETHSIPLEISTDFQLLYFLSVFGGAGADFTYGKAKGKTLSDANVSPLLCTGGGTCGGGKLLQVKLEADVNGERKAFLDLYHAFVGLQFNLPFVRIYGMVDKGINSDLLAGTIGIRVVY